MKWRCFCVWQRCPSSFRNLWMWRSERCGCYACFLWCCVDWYKRWHQSFVFDLPHLDNQKDLSSNSYCMPKMIRPKEKHRRSVNASVQRSITKYTSHVSSNLSHRISDGGWGESPYVCWTRFEVNRSLDSWRIAFFSDIHRKDWVSNFPVVSEWPSDLLCWHGHLELCSVL